MSAQLNEIIPNKLYRGRRGRPDWRQRHQLRGARSSVISPQMWMDSGHVGMLITQLLIPPSAKYEWGVRAMQNTRAACNGEKYDAKGKCNYKTHVHTNCLLAANGKPPWVIIYSTRREQKLKTKLRQSYGIPDRRSRWLAAIQNHRSKLLDHRNSYHYPCRLTLIRV